jgi:uncharacterized membrane protein YeaQ/YmgE (transglycosylase-associated protein family)
MGEKNAMSIISWLILGLIAGWIGSKIVNKTGEGFFLDIVLGVVGALVGGFLFSLFGAGGVTGLNLYSMFVAIVGSVVVLVVYHTIFGRSTT